MSVASGPLRAWHRRPGQGGVLSTSLANGMLVGREREVDVLVGVLRQGPAVAIVEGEAGIGKSRLVEGVLGSPEMSGATTLMGRCHPLREPFVLGPLVDVLRKALALPGTLALPIVAGALRRLVPEMEDQLPPALEPLIDGSAELHLLFRAIAEILGGVGRAVCVLEDVHWADDGTLEFLRFLLPQMPANLSLLLTYRPEELAAASPVRSLGSRRRSGVVESTVVLAPLDVGEVREMVSGILGAPDVSVEFAAYLTERTSGIPFAVEEVLRLVQDRHDVVHKDGRWVRRAIESLAVPPAVRDAVLERVGRLGNDARRITMAAAVAEVPADEALLTTVAGLNRARGVAGLCEALRAAVLWEFPGGYGFRHSLASQAVSESLTRPEFRRLHLRAARALEGLRPQPVARLAHHFHAAGEWPAAASWSEAAADVAIAVHDHGTAAEFLQQALRMPGVDGGDRARAAAKLGKVAAQAMAHHLEALPVLREVVDRCPMSRDARGEMRALLGELLMLSGDARAGRAEKVRALSELEERPELAALVMADLGQPRELDGTVAEHQEWLRRAARTAATQPDSFVRFQVLVARTVALLRLGDPAAWQLVDEIPWDGESADEQRALLRACLCLAGAAFHLGHYDRARSFVSDAERRADRLGQRDFLRSLETSAILQEWAVGHWDGLEARAIAHLAATADIPRASAAGTRVLGFLALASGSLDKADRLFHLLLDRSIGAGVVPGIAGAAAGIAMIRLLCDDPEEAIRASATGVDAIAAKGTWVWGAEVVPVAVEALIAAGRASEGARVTSAFRDGLEGCDAPLAHAALRLCEGLVLEGDGAHREAAVAFERAQREYARLPRPYDQARAATAEGRCHFAAADHQRGAAAWQDALALYAALGASGDVGRLRRMLREQSIVLPVLWRGGRRGYGSQLSPREEQVARLVAHGDTNPEIAKALHLSPKTVEHHVTSAMRKAGVRSRTALAAHLLGLDGSKNGGTAPSQESRGP